jgi:type VI protein secretion system component Hcp
MTMKKAMLVVVASALLSFIQIDNSHASEKMFLFIQGVPGEVTEPPHANWIFVNSAAWSHGVSPGGVTKTQFEALAVVKRVDFSSPMLALAAVDGRHFEKAFLELQTKRNNQPFIILKVTLFDVTVKAYAAADTIGGDTPTESVKLGFAKIEWLYNKQIVTPNGIETTPVRTGWDVINNRAF